MLGTSEINYWTGVVRLFLNYASKPTQSLLLQLSLKRASHWNKWTSKNITRHTDQDKSFTHEEWTYQRPQVLAWPQLHIEWLRWSQHQSFINSVPFLLCHHSVQCTNDQGRERHPMLYGHILSSKVPKFFTCWICTCLINVDSFQLMTSMIGHLMHSQN